MTRGEGLKLCKRTLSMHEMKMKGQVKVLAILSLLAFFMAAGLFLRGVDINFTRCECNLNTVEQSTHPQEQQTRNAHKKLQNLQSNPQRYLSYQPPGNGWNNQRIALENALVLANLLKRTLVVHPLAPHALGNKIKAGHHIHHGYVSYNLMQQEDLLPLSMFMDLNLMRKGTPVVEVTTTHPQFLSDFSHNTWRNICHSGGWGYWMDRVPEHTEEVALFTQQKFSSLGKVWREKCPKEQTRGERTNSPLVRYVTDLDEDPSEMLYFEKGTLFGIHIRFSTYEKALAAQNLVVNYVHYNSEVWSTVEKVAAKLGGFYKYNAIQVRRIDHMARKLAPAFWIDQMIQRNFSKSAPVYVATNDVNIEWFQPFLEAGFKLHFSTNFREFNFTKTRESLRMDFLGIHEQCICERADKFVGSPASTFDAFILRHRGEVKTQDGLMMDTLHTYWIGHQLNKTKK